MHENAANEALSGRTFGYAFDDIGNRKTATQSALNNNTSETIYVPNKLNQYDQLERPDPLKKLIEGLAHASAQVEVFVARRPPIIPQGGYTPTNAAAELQWPEGVEAEQPIVWRIPQGTVRFYSEASVSTPPGADWRYVVVRATRHGVGVGGQSLAMIKHGWMFFPPQTDVLLYDADGNMTEDGRWRYTWDAENRLTQMLEKPRREGVEGPPRQRLTFTYDSQSRRVRKVVESFSSSTNNWTINNDLRFLYDDWNLVAEFEMNLQTQIMNLKSSYAWGLDLSGTEQGAGGVGGLLFVKQSQTTANNSQPSQTALLAPSYDGNGNITTYINVQTGQVVSRHEYDPFGNELSLDSGLVSASLGSGVSLPSFKFSTKYTDPETGLCYYGYRYLSPELGRWVNRDPIEERGGINLMAIGGNEALNQTDALGLLVDSFLKSLIKNQLRKWGRGSADKCESGDIGGSYVERECTLIGSDEEPSGPFLYSANMPEGPHNPMIPEGPDNIKKCYYSCSGGHFTSEKPIHDETRIIRVCQVCVCPETPFGL